LSLNKNDVHGMFKCRNAMDGKERLSLHILNNLRKLSINMGLHSNQVTR